MWKKLTAISMGILMGACAAFVAMIPAARNTQAAVLVHDEQNIAEAIKTAQQTLSILTETQKQYLLMLTNIKSLTPESLLRFMAGQDENIASIVSMYTNYKDILGNVVMFKNSVESDVNNFKKLGEGDMNMMVNILTGNPTNSQREVERLAETAKLSNEIVASGEKILNMNKQIQQTSSQAEGEVQATQAGTEAVVLNNQIGVQQNIQMDTLIQMYSREQFQQLQRDRAEREFNNYCARQNMAFFKDIGF